MRTRMIIGLAGLTLLAVACADENASDPKGGGADAPYGKNCKATTVGEPELRRLTGPEVQATIEDVFPEIAAEWTGTRMGPDLVAGSGFTNDAKALLVSQQTASGLLDTAEDVASLVSSTAVLATVLPCAASAADTACAESFIQTYGRRLFRRTLTETETARYAELYAAVQAKAGFSTGIKWVLVSMMQSPHAVYRSEVGVVDGDQRVLSAPEVATALAYDFAGTTPSEELLAQAERGELASAESRVKAARALLETKRGRKNVHRFVDEWIEYKHIRGKTRDGVENFSSVSAHMVEETEAFVEQVLYAEDGGIDDLLTAPYTMLNAELASFYGYGKASGDDWTKVTRPDSWGVGLLAQGAVLASHSHTNSTSPTLRGMVVYTRLLCQTMPAPPADIPPIVEPAPGKVTTRERYEKQHIAVDTCRSCHQYSDPSGFAMEHFDAAGRFRADEDGLPIDTSGSIPFVGGAQAVDGQADLAAELAASEETQFCVSSLVATYTYGGAHGGVANGACAVAGPQQALLDGKIGLLSYWAKLAGQPHFTMRRLNDGG